MVRNLDDDDDDDAKISILATRCFPILRKTSEIGRWMLWDTISFLIETLVV